MRQKYFSVPHIFKGCRLPETQQQYCPCVVQFMYVFYKLTFLHIFSCNCISVKEFLFSNMYNLIGLVVRALTFKAEVQSSNLTRDCKNILVAWE